MARVIAINSLSYADLDMFLGLKALLKYVTSLLSSINIAQIPAPDAPHSNSNSYSKSREGMRHTLTQILIQNLGKAYY